MRVSLLLLALLVACGDTSKATSDGGGANAGAGEGSGGDDGENTGRQQAANGDAATSSDGGANDGTASSGGSTSGSGTTSGGGTESSTGGSSGGVDNNVSRDPFALVKGSKGVCYDGFPSPGMCGYDPSTSETSLAFFGSDAAASNLGSLWGNTSHAKASCGTDCRDDLGKLAAAHVNVIRLYGWDPRNDHRAFLDRCAELGIRVLVPVSNWFLQNDQANAENTSNTLLNAGNFGNAAGTDYHPAVAGVLFGNEPVLSGLSIKLAVDYTKAFLAVEKKRGYRRVAIGHPVEFAVRGGPLHQGKALPSWADFDEITKALSADADRLMLCPNTYNDANYLFSDAEATGTGYVALTYAKFGLPILFTEIGQDRLKPNYQNIIKGQLEGAAKYAGAHPEQLLGVTLFQYLDKGWMKGTTEGSFGMYTHGSTVRTIDFVAEDFTHWDVSTNGCAKIESLDATPIYDVTKAAFKP